MAKQIITNLVDDLDGSAAEETVSFALDGLGYEIDLSGKNAKSLRDFLRTFIEAGTKTGRVAGKSAQLSGYRPVSTSAQTTMNREQNQRIRIWAESNGWELADRGRIPQVIIDAFETKTPNPEWLAKQQRAGKVAEEHKARTPRKAAKAGAPRAEFVS